MTGSFISVLDDNCIPKDPLENTVPGVKELFTFGTQGARMSNRHNIRLPDIPSSGTMLMKLITYLLAAIFSTFLLSMFLMEHWRPISQDHTDDVFEKLRPTVKSAAFVGVDFGWMIGCKSGDLWYTKNGGRNWERTPATAVGGKFHTASFINERKGWAVGEGGTIWRSDDGGVSWGRISKLEKDGTGDWFMYADEIRFIDELNGWLAETFGIWRTTDGGANWKRVLAIGDPGVTGQPANVAFLNSSQALVGSSDGKVYRTDDAGTHWQIQELIDKGDFRGISFVTQERGWLNGYGPSEWGFALYSTEDGGKNWRAFPVKNRGISIHAIQFTSKSEGWAVGVLPRRESDLAPKGLVMHTRDGGESWEEVLLSGAEESFEQIHFADNLHGWLLARENVYRTEDGGKTWRVVLKISRVKDTS